MSSSKSARVRVVAALLLASPAALPSRLASGEEPAPAPAGTPIERLRAMKEVSGSAVGEGGDEGEFFALSKVLIAGKDEPAWRALLSEKSPVARAMGLVLLVRTKGKDALPDLRARLSDRERFTEFPGGCCGQTITLGEFARELARNRHHLDVSKDVEALVDAAGRLGVDVTILADDRMATAHREVVRALREDAELAKLDLTLEGLRRLVPGLSDVALVKAVARFPESDRVRAFLVARVGDATLAKEVRLAAASGLTLHVHDEAVAAIRGARAALDAAAGTPVADRLLAAIEARREMEKRWAPIDAKRTHAEHEAMADEIRRALVADHPLAIERLLAAFGLAVAEGALRETLVESLFRIAGRLGEFAAPWDAYADAPYLLETAVVPAWGEAEDDLRLTPEEAKRLRVLVGPRLAAR